MKLPTPPRRRWLQFGLKGVFLAVTIFAVGLGWLFRPHPFPYAFPDPDKQIRRVEIVFGLGDNTVAIEVVDPTMIESLVIRPFLSAQLDSSPARYKSLGDMHIYYDDGAEEGAWMFLPWGHFKYGGEYGIAADLSLLRDECRRQLEQSNAPSAALLLRDGHFDP